MKCKIHKQHDCIHNHTNIYLTNVVKNLLQHGLLQLQQLKLRTQWNPVKYKTLLKVRTWNCDLAEKSTQRSKASHNEMKEYDVKGQSTLRPDDRIVRRFTHFKG